jgi:hypothetical protein
MSSLIISLNLIGLTAANVCPPFDGCTWGFSANEISIQPGFVITDAVLSLTNVRPADHCLNPSLTIRLLDNPPLGLSLLKDSNQTTIDCFQDAPALSAAWLMNEFAGTQANNSLPGGNPALFINSPVWIPNEGVSFSDGQYLQIEDSANLCSRAPLAVSLWVKIRSPRRYSKLLIKPFETRSAPWELAAIDLGPDGLTPRFLLSEGTPDGQYAAAFNPACKISPNQWVHLLGTFDGSVMELWLNGQSIAQKHTDELTVGSNSMPICIGGRLEKDTLDGLIRDVRIYSGPAAEKTLQWMQTSDHFAPHGTFLKSFDSRDIQTAGRTISLSLRQINNPASWVYEVFPSPLTLNIPSRQTPLSFSSAMFELLDCAGRKTPWGIGIDTDGFLFDTVFLALTIESLDGSQSPFTQTLSYRNIYAPVILPRMPITAEPQMPISFAVTALDLDKNPVSVSAQTLPTGASFDGRTFQWTPTQDQIGQWQITFIATDGVMSSKRPVLITIQEPTPIFSPLENQIIYELQPLTVPIQAVNLAGQPVPVTASALPPGAIFHENRLEWKPAPGQAGIYTISFTAANEIRQETTSIQITVLPYKLPAKTKTILIL